MPGQEGIQNEFASSRTTLNRFDLVAALVASSCYLIGAALDYMYPVLDLQPYVGRLSDMNDGHRFGLLKATHAFAFCVS